jgi:steroid delta-isomerase-like uncharacterized protein
MSAAGGPAATVRAYIDALNRGDADAIAACVAEEFVNEHTAALSETTRGRAAYRVRLTAFLREFRELRYDVEELIAEGARVAVAYRMSARWVAPGTDASGARPFSIRGMFRARVEDGRIIHRVDYWDSREFERQIRT